MRRTLLSLVPLTLLACATSGGVYAPDPSSPDFTAPAYLDTARMRLEPLAPRHVELDYAALMSSNEHLRTTLQWGGWPRDGFTVEENLSDMEMHWGEFQRREAYAYTVLEPDRSRCIGCIYINQVDDGFDPREASLEFWVIEEELASDLDVHLVKSVLSWLEEDWPLDRVVFFTHVKNARGAELLKKLGLERRKSASPDHTVRVWERRSR